MRKVVFSLVIISFTVSAFANQSGVDYLQDQGVVMTHRQAVQKAAGEFNPASSLPHYNPHPGQGRYYRGVATDHSDISSQGSQALSNDPAGGVVFNAFNTRPKIKINPTSKDFDDSRLAKNDSYDITHGISDQYIDCKKHRTCRTVTKKVTCHKTNTVTLNCTQSSTVKIQTAPYQTSVSYSGTLTSPTTVTGTITLPEDGVVTSVQVALGASHNIYSCQQWYWGNLAGQKLSRFHPSCGGGSSGTGFIFSGSGLSIPVKKGAPLVFTLKCSMGFFCSSGIPNRRAWTVTERVTRTHKTGTVVWQPPVCP